jgi:hypothetical protein
MRFISFAPLLDIKRSDDMPVIDWEQAQVGFSLEGRILPAIRRWNWQRPLRAALLRALEILLH